MLQASHVRRAIAQGCCSCQPESNARGLYRTSCRALRESLPAVCDGAGGTDAESSTTLGIPADAVHRAAARTAHVPDTTLQGRFLPPADPATCSYFRCLPFNAARRLGAAASSLEAPAPPGPRLLFSLSSAFTLHSNSGPREPAPAPSSWTPRSPVFTVSPPRRHAATQPWGLLPHTQPLQQQSNLTTLGPSTLGVRHLHPHLPQHLGLQQRFLSSAHHSAAQPRNRDIELQRLERGAAPRTHEAHKVLEVIVRETMVPNMSSASRQQRLLQHIRLLGPLQPGLAVLFLLQAGDPRRLPECGRLLAHCLAIAVLHAGGTSAAPSFTGVLRAAGGLYAALDAQEQTRLLQEVASLVHPGMGVRVVLLLAGLQAIGVRPKTLLHRQSSLGPKRRLLKAVATAMPFMGPELLATAEHALARLGLFPDASHWTPSIPPSVAAALEPRGEALDLTEGPCRGPPLDFPDLIRAVEAHGGPGAPLDGCSSVQDRLAQAGAAAPGTGVARRPTAVLHLFRALARQRVGRVRDASLSCVLVNLTTCAVAAQTLRPEQLASLLFLAGELGLRPAGIQKEQLSTAAVDCIREMPEEAVVDVATALSRLGVHVLPRAVAARLRRAVIGALAHVGPAHVSKAAWALRRMAGGRELGGEVSTALASALLRVGSGLSGHQVVVLLWVLVRAEQPLPDPVLRVLGAGVERAVAEGLGPTQAANTLWAVTYLLPPLPETVVGRLLDAVAANAALLSPRLAVLALQGLERLGSEGVGVAHPGAVEALAAAVVREPRRLPPRMLAECVAALQALGVQPTRRWLAFEPLVSRLGAQSTFEFMCALHADAGGEAAVREALWRALRLRVAALAETMEPCTLAKCVHVLAEAGGLQRTRDASLLGLPLGLVRALDAMDVEHLSRAIWAMAREPRSLGCTQGVVDKIERLVVERCADGVPPGAAERLMEAIGLLPFVHAHELVGLVQASRIED